MVWAWERAEDLRFVHTPDVGVAYLSRTVYLEGDQVRVRPRVQPMVVPPGMRAVAAIRIEGGETAPSRSRDQLSQATEAVLGAARPGVFGIQIDFDARESDRVFYAALLGHVRHRLPESMSLSITALASWCLDDTWIAALPIDDAVPMLFRMGPDGPAIAKRLEQGGDFSLAMCRQSAGVSTDEPGVRVPAGRRLYIFHPGAWSEPALVAAMRDRQ
jgi:hypothetical protein